MSWLSRSHSLSQVMKNVVFTGVAVWRLHHEIRDEVGRSGQLAELLIGIGASQNVGNRRGAGLLPELRSDNLGVQMPAQGVRRQNQVVAEFAADLFSFLVEEDHRDHRAQSGCCAA